MKVLKTLFIILLALLGIFVILGLVGDKTYRVERSTVIPASVGVVYANVSDLTNHEKWSPWKEKDPAMTVELSGTPGTVGQVSAWTGNDQVGSGSQTIIALEQDRSVRTDLKFLTPWESSSVATFDLEAHGDSTKVTWGIEGENDFMGRAMSAFLDMDGMVGPDFEKGLAKLSAVSMADQEAWNVANANTVDGFKIEIVSRPAMTYLGVRKDIGWSDMQKFFGSSFGAAMGAMGAAGVEPTGAPSGLFFVWDEENKRTEMLAGIPIPADKKGQFSKKKDLIVYEQPAGKAYMIAYYGGYNGSGKAHEAIDKKFTMDNTESGGLAIEEYITDPGTEPDSTKWLTHVIYPIK